LLLLKPTPTPPVLVIDGIGNSMSLDFKYVQLSSKSPGPRRTGYVGAIEVSKETTARGIPLKRAVTFFVLLAVIAVGLGLWFGYRAPIGKVAERSVAVLPFENLSADPDGAFFAEGVEDEIRNDLAKVAERALASMLYGR